MNELFEYWQLLLIPAFFALGWIAARVDMQQVVHESRTLPRSYFQGLNFLLNEQPDKAIDSFLEVAKVDSQTVELHFALGNLFRRRGETERAIRMHQNLIDLPDLDDKVRLQALSELGQDYLKAGLLDRAEEIFNKLLGTDFEEEAKRNLLEIYQVEKEWLKAIQIARELPDVASHRDIAEYYCELAANEIMRSRPDSAREYLEVATQENRKCVRASLLQGDLLMQEVDLNGAIEAWQRIEQQDPAYLALVAQRLLEAYRKLERPGEGIALLSGYLERYPSLDLLEVVYQLILESEGVEVAYRLVRAELQRNPTLLGLEKLMSARLPLVASEVRPDVELARTIIQTYTKRLSRYRCDNCGFKARQFYWRCPACGGWETYPPRRSEEFDQSL
ncbi:MAG: lipopolysaccharide assembly protein LapB [Gammaproteobacteria bacterium]|nr:lipopolysaccharide assembly protein LapB [Gammaproteobacteria bacterium]MBU2432051.1 lipopolysaccharide assembly protein LapB [Gammaproteobacteria bacterium]MBU2449054.1 lipopolysaccharide assembly protein LapB [Gammaproteobacteria bacterium]